MIISVVIVHQCIRSISRDDLVNYISTHYIAPRMVLAAAGGQRIFVVQVIVVEQL